MSTTAEALAPQTDATNVAAADAQPDGAEPKPANEADSSSAAPVKTSENLEPEAKGIQRRFDELTRLRRDAERREEAKGKEVDFWRERALKYEQPKEPEPSAKAKTLADFNFDEAEHTRYLAMEAGNAAAAKIRAELKAEETQKEKQRRAATYVTRAKEFAKDKPDFTEVASSAQISDEVAEIVVGLETGPELAFHLGKNPDIAGLISAMPREYAAYELGQIAARLKFERDKAGAAKSLISKAPAPAATIEGAGDPGTGSVKPDEPDSDKLSDAEWARRRNKQAAKRGS